MELLPAHTRATAAPRPTDAACAPGLSEREQAIPSARLLRGESSVLIDHEGMQYVLRATRAGKLILTK